MELEKEQKKMQVKEQGKEQEKEREKKQAPPKQTSSFSEATRVLSEQQQKRSRSVLRVLRRRLRIFGMPDAANWRGASSGHPAPSCSLPQSAQLRYHRRTGSPRVPNSALIRQLSRRRRAPVGCGRQRCGCCS